MGLPGGKGPQSIQLDSWMGQDKGPGWGCNSFRSATSKSLQIQASWGVISASGLAQGPFPLGCQVWTPCSGITLPSSPRSSWVLPVVRGSRGLSRSNSASHR